MELVLGLYKAICHQIIIQGSYKEKFANVVNVSVLRPNLSGS